MEGKIEAQHRKHAVSSATASHTQARNGTAIFVDNRASTITQRMHTVGMADSPQATVQRRVQQMADSGTVQLMPGNRGVIQRVANFNDLTDDEKQDASNFFDQWKGLLGVHMRDDATLFVYDYPAVQILLNQILKDLDVNRNPINRRRFLSHVDVALVEPDNALAVNIVWSIQDRHKRKLNQFPNFLRDLEDSRNYNAVNGRPRFANAHFDNTGNGEWKLQADRELRGSGSRDRLCIDVTVAGDGTIAVTVKAFLENTH